MDYEEPCYAKTKDRKYNGTIMYIRCSKIRGHGTQYVNTRQAMSTEYI